MIKILDICLAKEVGNMAFPNEPCFIILEKDYKMIHDLIYMNSRFKYISFPYCWITALQRKIV